LMGVADGNTFVRIICHIFWRPSFLPACTSFQINLLVVLASSAAPQLADWDEGIGLFIALRYGY
jgi:hypothetical protein